MASVQKVLLIDDDEIVNSINRVIIKHAGFAEEIQTISDVREALDFLATSAKQEELPDVIFLDLNMPDMDGWDFVEAFENLSLPKSVRIVMLTSSISLKDQNKANTFKSIASFLSKPLSQELLNKFEEEHLS